MMWDILLGTIIVGIGGTAAMDLWAILLNRLFGQALPNWAMVGRWFAHVPRGVIFHKDIAKSARVAHERAIGWLAHYAVGILYAGVLIVAAGPQWLANPTFLPALIVGLVTVGAGWFVLQPGMGAGWAASLKPNPWRIRILNIAAHLAFASGLYGSARLISGL
jgi:hypothetical protein